MEHQITSEEQLRALVGEAHELAVGKSTSLITEPLKRYIELSPFLCLATHNRDGSCDVSPRGDAPGFVRVQDEKTLIIPDRPGNKRHDSIINQPRMSLLFMIPGVLDTVRINGTAIISTDPAILGLFPVNGKTPTLAIVVSVEEAFGHCSKALRRAKLWEQDYVPTTKAPTLTEMMAAHLELPKETQDVIHEAIENNAKTGLY